MPRIIFTILSTISMIMAIAIFVAGSLIFIFMQLYQFIFERGEFVGAVLVVLPSIFLFSYAFLETLKKAFLATLQEDTKQEKKLSFGNKFAIGVLFYEILRLFFRSKKTKEPYCPTKEH